MSNQTIIIEKGNNGYSITLNGDPSLPLNPSGDSFRLKMRGNSLVHEMGGNVTGYRMEVPFWNSDDVRIEMGIKINGKSHHVVELIGSEDFRDARYESIPPFLIQERFVSISIEDTDDVGVKLLVFNGK